MSEAGRGARRRRRRDAGRLARASDRQQAMNLSELFIRRPVLTVLLNAAIVVAGVDRLSARSRSRRCRATTRRSSTSRAQLPGASPETMATSVALQLEKQFQTIPGLAVISSSNTLGVTSVTLEFDQGRDIDAAVGRRAGGAAARGSASCRSRDDACRRRTARSTRPTRRCCSWPLTSPSLEPVGPERLRRAPDLADAVDARRRRPGQHLRPEALRGARARAARRAARRATSASTS